MIRVVKFSTLGPQMRIKMFMFQAKHLIAYDICEEDRGRPFFIFWKEKITSGLPFHPGGATIQQTVLPANKVNLNTSLSLAEEGCPDGITWLFRPVESYASFEKIRWEQIFVMRIWQHSFENLVLIIKAFNVIRHRHN